MLSEMKKLGFELKKREMIDILPKNNI